MDEKIIKKICIVYLFFCMILCLGNSSQAKPFFNPVKKAIKEADISSSALIAVSFKEIDNKKTKFEMNSNVPMSAASVQKLVTIIPTLDTLGKEYIFSTKLYKKGNNLYLKLGADPYLTSKDLRNMLSCVTKYNLKNIDKFYIDDSILDKTEWGEGWMWDNELNSLMPKFGSYNLDKNLINVTFYKTNMNAPVEIKPSVFYPLSFKNDVVTGNEDSIALAKENYISPDFITARGVISKDTDITIPVNYLKRYFILRLEDSIRKQKIPFYTKFEFAHVPNDAILVAQTTHTMENALTDILQKSDNMISETTFKIAGGKYINGIGTTSKAIRMFDSYYNEKGIDTSNIKIVDASGVSKNNLLTANFVTEVLSKDYNSKNSIKHYMAQPGETGTLLNRMLYFQENLKAKTGTLTNVSALAGYITARSGKTYAFCILINDPKSKSADKKAFEEYVLRKAYGAF